MENVELCDSPDCRRRGTVEILWAAKRVRYCLEHALRVVATDHTWHVIARGE